MADHIAPPTYSQQDPVDSIGSEHYNHPPSDPQILIIPTVDAVNFQKGYLGAEGETAAIEGELQIKGIDVARWSHVSITLYSFENAYQHEIELYSQDVILYSKSDNHEVFPSSMPFSIPLLPDTPQSLQTAHSALALRLTASLHPIDLQLPPLSKSLIVYTRRYTKHSFNISICPELHVLEEPTRVEVELPRNAFTSEEILPLYITVPPPTRETVVDKGLRLRNIRVELVRIVKVKRERYEDSDSDSEISLDIGDVHVTASSSFDNVQSNPAWSTPSSSKMPLSPIFLGSSYKTAIARSGASCRFHSSRPIKLRFVLHQTPSGSPSESRTTLERMDSDTECGSITQSTLFHSVSFQIKVHISFVDMSSQTERISTMVIPLTILPPPAPLPQVSQSIDEAYSKKHDRPPMKTVREEEVDPLIPHYMEGEAGPSSGAPPPFEERDAPPPFFVSGAEASSSLLPTFQESEREIFLPDASNLLGSFTQRCVIPGEGVVFGFHSAQQFDGHSEDMQRSSTPPPSLEMASQDRDLTVLTEQPINYDDLGLVIDNREESVDMEDQLPPPPPAMDDPSDPPPSIDSDFRSPVMGRDTSPGRTTPPVHGAYHQVDDLILRSTTPTPASEISHEQPSHGHAPPPYLNPDSHVGGEGDQVARPPPYVD